jgi:hypothetical protein
MRRWSALSGYAAAATAATFGLAVAAGIGAGERSFAGFPYAAIPGIVFLLVAAAVAVATLKPRRWQPPVLWAIAGVSLAGSCWILLNLVELALAGTVTDRDGNPGWTEFLERLALVIVGVLLAATAVAVRRRTAGSCPRCGTVHAPGRTARRYPGAQAAPRTVRMIAYAGCLAWLPYAGSHTLAAFGVPGIEPDGYRPRADAGVALWVGVGLAVFLLLGLVHPWGMVFPRWTLWLAGRRVPRFLPIVPVWLIAPTFVLYGLGAGVYAVLLATGVLEWHGTSGIGAIGAAQPISFAGYGIALSVAVISYQLRTHPTCAEAPPVPSPAASVL